MHSVSVAAKSFPAVAPFDLARSLAFVRGFTPMHDEQIVTPTTLTKAFLVEGRPVVARVRQLGGVAAPAIAYELSPSPTHPITPVVERAAVDRLRRFLGTDEDLAPFYAIAADDPPMAELTRRLRGLHHVTFPSAFEAACWGVLYQRIPLPRARDMKRAIVRAFGATVPSGFARDATVADDSGRVAPDGADLPVFPDAATMARASEPQLRELLGPGRRAKAVAAIARAFAAIDESWLRAAPVDEARAWLRRIYGVGEFTSGFVLYRALGRFDGATMFSPRLVEAAERVYGRAMTAAEMRRTCARYSSWGGHWMLYLWASTFV
jgi:DNA-3-methyladenine glycosylase II